MKRAGVNAVFAAVLAATLPEIAAANGAVGELANRSEAIVVGEVLSGRQTGPSAKFSLTVVRTIKGTLAPGESISVSWSTGLRAERDLAGNYGLWFLGKGGDGLWHLLGALPGRVPFELAYLKLPRTSTAMEAGSKPAPAAVEDLIANELAAALPSHDDGFYNLATALLGMERCSVCGSIYASLRKSADPEVRFVGLAGMVKRNDWSALAEIADSVELVRHLDVGPSIVSDALRPIRTDDPTAIRSLGRIALSAENGFREGAGVQRSAAIAISCIHTRDTLPFLVGLLGSADSMVRQEAMFGISRFVDNLPIQTPGTTANGKSDVPQGRPHTGLVRRRSTR